MDYDTRAVLDPIDTAVAAFRRARYAADPMPLKCVGCDGTLSLGVAHRSLGVWLCLNCM
jgi:hypothetical protein